MVKPERTTLYLSIICRNIISFLSDVYNTHNEFWGFFAFPFLFLFLKHIWELNKQRIINDIKAAT